MSKQQNVSVQKDEVRYPLGKGKMGCLDGMRYLIIGGRIFFGVFFM